MLPEIKPLTTCEQRREQPCEQPERLVMGLVTGLRIAETFLWSQNINLLEHGPVVQYSEGIHRRQEKASSFLVVFFRLQVNKVRLRRLLFRDLTNRKRPSNSTHTERHMKIKRKCSAKFQFCQ